MVAIFSDSGGTYDHTVIAVTGDSSHYTTDAGHQQPNGIYTIATFFWPTPLGPNALIIILRMLRNPPPPTSRPAMC